MNRKELYVGAIHSVTELIALEEKHLELRKKQRQLIFSKWIKEEGVEKPPKHAKAIYCGRCRECTEWYILGSKEVMCERCHTVEVLR